MPSASALDAVTLDAMGTLVDLENPVPSLQAALAAAVGDRPGSVGSGHGPGQGEAECGRQEHGCLVLRARGPTLVRDAKLRKYSVSGPKPIPIDRRARPTDWSTH